MHIAEGFLPISHAIGWTAVATPFVAYGAYCVHKQVKEQPETGLLLGAAGAFSFVLSALKIPSVTGSSSHPTGTGLGAVLFKPPVMAFIGTIVLLFQALLLAHGGITTLGANVTSMAIVGPWVGYACWSALRKAKIGIEVAIFGAAFFADISTYMVTATQLALAHHGGNFFSALGSFLALYAPTQLPLALIEAIVTVLIIRALKSIAAAELIRLGVMTSSESIEETAQPTPNQEVSA
ncbi:energy-coupling factor ABC transporter permease [Corynebacterium sp. sy017]|uniref:energy-coupling factor ABC transporter permease n=1 Tax=unclassified Corynebacterium TaxID=2624378 RepID=UPI001187079C|nr:MULTISPECIES: energy-coupling factor ABC transporter permease [unclassified Corynebacterium]MBP3088237.1 energy-coupling factor ABC transporter permease [Corynebacterium sp. sy017]QDZ43423.1 energy-coupling factor ABC transporter permease [Corynebacterium sp. sy039]TSD91567.1 energy-coupling factor ABC transporter permease [Corynebacterium sp. SY003]